MKVKKVKEEKLVTAGKYNLVRTTYEPPPEGDIKVKINKPVKISIKKKQ